MVEFKMPALGAEMESGRLIEWKVKPGDHVKRGQIIAVVDTDKAAVDVEVWSDGVIEKLIVEPGARVPVGEVLAILRGESEVAAATERLRVSPLARRRAEELHVDLSQVPVSRPFASIGVEDVEREAKRRVAGNVAPITPKTERTIDRNEAMRATIAAAMARSKREIPHYYLASTIDLGKSLDWLICFNEKRSVTERMLYSVILIKAVALSLRRFPEFNGFWKDGCFQPSKDIHLGVAISLRSGGLVAPAIHNVDQKSLPELMSAMTDLVARTRAGSLRGSELSDPTVTVTNISEAGIETVFGVIYPPQVALVGFGAIAEQACVENGKIFACRMIRATLSADHRASDGHRGALFLGTIGKLLQEPDSL